MLAQYTAIFVVCSLTIDAVRNENIPVFFCFLIQKIMNQLIESVVNVLKNLNGEIRH